MTADFVCYFRDIDTFIEKLNQLSVGYIPAGQFDYASLDEKNDAYFTSFDFEKCAHCVLGAVIFGAFQKKRDPETY